MYTHAQDTSFFFRLNSSFFHTICSSTSRPHSILFFLRVFPSCCCCRSSSSSAFLFLCRYTRFSGDKLRKRPFSNPCHLCRAAVPFSRVDLMCAVFPCVQTPLTWSELPRGNGEIEPIPNTALSPPDQFCIKGGQPRVLYFRVSRHWYVAANAWDF